MQFILEKDDKKNESVKQCLYHSTDSSRTKAEENRIRV